MIPYPSQVPPDDLNIVLGAIRSHSLKLDSHEVAKDAWLTLGYGLRTAVGEVQGAPDPTDTIPYPTSVPTDELLVVIASLRGGRPPTPEIAKAIWETVGFGLFSTIGDWTPPPPPAPTPVPGEVIVKHLETVVENQVDGKVMGAIPIPWGLIIQWGLGLLADIIKKKIPT